MQPDRGHGTISLGHCRLPSPSAAIASLPLACPRHHRAAPPLASPCHIQASPLSSWPRLLRLPSPFVLSSPPSSPSRHHPSLALVTAILVRALPLPSLSQLCQHRPYCARTILAQLHHHHHAYATPLLAMSLPLPLPPPSQPYPRRCSAVLTTVVPILASSPSSPSWPRHCHLHHHPGQATVVLSWPTTTLSTMFAPLSLLTSFRLHSSQPRHLHPHHCHPHFWTTPLPLPVPSWLDHRLPTTSIPTVAVPTT